MRIKLPYNTTVLINSSKVGIKYMYGYFVHFRTIVQCTSDTNITQFSGGYK